MWKKIKKNASTRATQEEKEIIVAEAEHFDEYWWPNSQEEVDEFLKKETLCCEPTVECPSPSEWCCSKCPATCNKRKELRKKYEELDSCDDIVEESKCSNIVSCSMCTKVTIIIVAVLLALYIITR